MNVCLPFTPFFLHITLTYKCIGVTFNCVLLGTRVIPGRQRGLYFVLICTIPTPVQPAGLQFSIAVVLNPGPQVPPVLDIFRCLEHT